MVKSSERYPHEDDMNKNLFCACALGAALACGAATTNVPLEKAGNLEPWAQIIATDTLGVTFFTGGAAYGRILWRQSETEDWKEAVPETIDGLIRANGKIQRAFIKGFDPKKPVYLKPVSKPIKNFGAYKVDFAEEKEGKVVKLKQPLSPDGRITIGLVCDLHNNTNRLFPALSAAGDDLSLCVLMGDQCDAPGSAADVINNFVTPLKALTEKGLMTLVLRGNHECRGAGAREIPEYIARPNDKFYGAFTLGCARFVFLDTGEDKPKDHSEYSGLIDFDEYLEEEAEWLKREVSGDEFRNADWRIVFMHIPPREATKEHSYPVTENGARIFAPILKGQGVDLVVSAHEHEESFLNEEEAKKYDLDFPLLIGAGGSKHKDNTLGLRLEVAPSELVLPKQDWRKTKETKSTQETKKTSEIDDILSKIGDIWSIFEKNRQKSK